MHWDLRLDIDGVLVSWAVPRGPTLTKERRLAVLTEPHPIEYADFEGIIPAGNYGAGAMIVWDRGVYRTVDAGAAAQALERGKLDLILFGHKLRGRWSLVRTREAEGGRNWLFVRKGSPDGLAPDVVQAAPCSVFSGLTVEELRAGVDRTDELRAAAMAAGAPLAPLPRGALRPMLAQEAERPPHGDGWILELKYDGMRVLALKQGIQVRLIGRSGRDVSGLFPEIVAAVGHLPCKELVIDGEVVALDERGASSFSLLQSRMHAGDRCSVAEEAWRIPVCLYGFDILSVAGCDVRGLKLLDRKRLLHRLLPAKGVVRQVETFEADAATFFRSVSELGLEGLVAKQRGSSYRSGERSAHWRKVKVWRSADLAVVGFRRGRGTRRDLGALMLAWRARESLRYAGNVGSGLSPSAVQELLTTLAPNQRTTPAFEGGPKADRDTVYVEPTLVAEVRYAQRSDAGILRHPVLLRMRPDKGLGDVDALPAHILERGGPRPASPEPMIRHVAFRPTNLEKVFWRAEGYTKGDLLDYYERAWPWLSPYLRDRPLVLTRYPNGVEGKSFFQKSAPDFTPEWVSTQRIDDTDFFVCNELDTLRYIVNLGCIPLHIWSARVMHLDRPDWVILDLDPKGAAFGNVVRVARRAHALLSELGAPHFVKTSGQDGLHVLIPTGGQLGHQDARRLAELISRCVADAAPEIATLARPLGARGGKVYLDFLQNGYGKTIAAPFSVRPRPGAPVSMSLRWPQVTARLHPASFTIRTAIQRLERNGDPMLSVLETAVEWKTFLQRLEQRLQR
jgi:bifunctional non-homologous end joining protein LigD